MNYNEILNSALDILSKYLVYELIVLGIILVIIIISNFNIFERADRNGFLSLIPFYNIYVYLEIVNKDPKLVFTIFVPILGWLYLYITIINNLCERFNKNIEVFTMLFPYIGLPIIAFSRDEYTPKQEEEEINILDIDNVGVDEDQEFNYGFDGDIRKNKKKK